MDFDISEKVKEWASESGQELDRIIKKELSKFGIDEEYGLSRVRVNTKPAVDICSGITKLSDWYIDGCLVFSILRKVDIENPRLDFIKTGENSFKVVPNGKSSPYSTRLTVQYSIQEHKPDEFSSFIMSRFERRKIKMDVKMCDRCQRVYIPGEKVIDSYGEVIKDNFNKIAIFKDKVTVNYKSFDICPYCAKDFLNWMKGDEN